jgi:hypothetical protein
LLEPLKPISLCAAIAIYPGAIKNDGHRSLTNYEWSIDSIVPSSQDVVAINNILSDHNKFQKTTLSIPELILPEISNITFSLKFENFLGLKGQSFGSILTLNKASP